MGENTYIFSIHSITSQTTSETYYTTEETYYLLYGRIKIFPRIRARWVSDKITLPTWHVLAPLGSHLRPSFRVWDESIDGPVGQSPPGCVRTSVCTPDCYVLRKTPHQSPCLRFLSPRCLGPPKAVRYAVCVRTVSSRPQQVFSWNRDY